ncbi:carotenoid ester lipase precursor [Multifurca ochricompacta]|uniref:Carotenoid ester lipase n=1 Tax=Multifurca ochricompacta TaxID=376703 RepID=A0AAD4M392_9AGAM|nr:carotenoid ester lipase precursor [Multifurca ochricompacta]
MLTKHTALALLAVGALSGFASPQESLVVQESDHRLAADHICFDTKPPAPQIILDDGVFTGIRKGDTDQFLGIPYAEPPINDLRLRQPKPLPPYGGKYDAQVMGKSCAQQKMTLPNGLDLKLVEELGIAVGRMVPFLAPEDEDCLTINVVKPSNIGPGSNLPVLVWFYGGGFENGWTAMYDGGLVVSRSIEIGEPIVFVSMNYRLSAFGFLAGKEAREAKIGNLGLQDQRLALKWVQTYISHFGGDPSKVTMWGESSGAMSVALQLVTNKGNQEDLYRGAIMHSGGQIPVGDIENGQQYYDFMVEKTGCKTAKNTLDCLRRAPFKTFKSAMDESPNFFAYQGVILAWLPRVDGVFLTEPPQHSILRGHVSNVPVITGNCDDDGSLFAVSTINISTTADLRGYLKTHLMPKAKDEEIDLLLKYYPDDQRAGCPFDTGLRNALSAQYKRTAALQGDFVFHAPRRFFLKHRGDKQNAWAYVYKRGKSTPFIGTAHGSDLPNAILGKGELMDYSIQFANNLNPNGDKGLGVPWPQWNSRDPKLIILQDSDLFPIVHGKDDYRTDPLNYVANMSLLYPI